MTLPAQLGYVSSSSCPHVGTRVAFVERRQRTKARVQNARRFSKVDGNDLVALV